MSKQPSILDLFQTPNRQINGVKTISNLHEFYILGEIQSPDNYIEVFDQIRHAGENDVVKIYINSPGGDVFTAIQFMRVLSETNAYTQASIEGMCCSAATIIFLNCDYFEITDHSVFMFHNYSGGTIGKGGEMYDQLVHERKWSETLLRKVYKDFLTEEEIQSILDNKDMWMDSDEVMSRMENRLKKAEEAQEEAAEAAKEAEKPVKARKKVS